MNLQKEFRGDYKFHVHDSQNPLLSLKKHSMKSAEIYSKDEAFFLLDIVITNQCTGTSAQ